MRDDSSSCDSAQGSPDNMSGRLVLAVGECEKPGCAIRAGAAPHKKIPFPSAATSLRAN